MQTPSHFLMTAGLRKVLPRIPMIKSAVWLGAVAPDIPLVFLSLGGYVYFHKILGWPMRETFRHLYDYLFFQDPFWIVFQNFLHAPIILGAGLIALWKIHGRQSVTESWWFWFFAACLLHATVDIFTHHNDGPLVFFPFNWHYRFLSPVSYWDNRYFAAEFSRFETALDALLAIYLAGPPVWRWIQRVLRRTPAEG